MRGNVRPSIKAHVLFQITKELKRDLHEVAGYKITYFVAILSYDNYYINLRNYSNSLLSGLL